MELRVLGKGHSKTCYFISIGKMHIMCVHMYSLVGVILYRVIMFFQAAIDNLTKMPVLDKGHLP